MSTSTRQARTRVIQFLHAMESVRGVSSISKGLSGGGGIASLNFAQLRVAVGLLPVTAYPVGNARAYCTGQVRAYLATMVREQPGQDTAWHDATTGLTLRLSDLATLLDAQQETPAA